MLAADPQVTDPEVAGRGRHRRRVRPHGRAHRRRHHRRRRRPGPAGLVHASTARRAASAARALRTTASPRYARSRRRSSRRRHEARRRVTDGLTLVNRADEGATAVEYAIMVSLIAVVIIVAVVALGGTTSSTYSCSSDAVATRRATYAGARARTTGLSCAGRPGVELRTMRAHVRGSAHGDQGLDVLPVRRRDHEGAAAVEFAIIMIPLFLLLFGIIEFGLAYNRQQGMHAAGAGRRAGGLHRGRRMRRSARPSPGRCSIVDPRRHDRHRERHGQRRHRVGYAADPVDAAAIAAFGGRSGELARPTDTAMPTGSRSERVHVDGQARTGRVRASRSRSSEPSVRSSIVRRRLRL